MQKRELILLGMGASRQLCPFDSEVWSCNNGYRQIMQRGGHCEKIFMTHIQHFVRGHWSYLAKESNLLIAAGIETFNIHRCKDLNTKLYPLKRICKKFNSEFFSDTICYMVAYAIDQATKIDKNPNSITYGKPILKYPFRIRFFGVDMKTKDEYELEKGGIEYWIGIARGLGIDVEISEFSTLCTTCTGKPYGIKNYKIAEIDPWGLLKSNKRGILFPEHVFSKRQMKKLAKYSDLELSTLTDGKL